MQDALDALKTTSGDQWLTILSNFWALIDSQSNLKFISWVNSVDACPYYLTLESDVTNDSFINYFDHVNHVLAFSTDHNAGLRNYDLCAHSNWNGATSCVHFAVNVTDL